MSHNHPDHVSFLEGLGRHAHHQSGQHPADTRRWINVDLTLVQRRRRWTNVKPTLIQRIVCAGQPRDVEKILGQCILFVGHSGAIYMPHNCPSASADNPIWLQTSVDTVLDIWWEPHVSVHDSDSARISYINIYITIITSTGIDLYWHFYSLVIALDATLILFERVLSNILIIFRPNIFFIIPCYTYFIL